MTGTFTDRMDELIAQFEGIGHIDARVTVDQAYAKYQELREDLEHPHGGQAHYARDGLMEHLDEYWAEYARGLLTSTGTDIKGAGERVAKRLAGHVAERAPRLIGNLAESVHPTAEADGVVYFDQPPVTPRLSDDELRRHRNGGRG